MQHHRSVSVGLLVVCMLAGCASPELKQAHRLAGEGKWDQAVAAYQDAQRKAPFDEKIQRQLEQAKTAAAAEHYALGKLAFENHRLADALQEFKLALGLDPSKAEYHAMIADALRLKESQEQLKAAKKLQNLGRMEEALTALERAVELDPTQTTALDGITELTKQQRAAKTFGTTTETFDLNGNLATTTDAGVTTTYTWNARNQLTGMSRTGLTASFTYDSFGRRTGRTVNGTTANYVYDGLNPVQEKNGAAVTANLPLLGGSCFSCNRF